MKYSVFLLLVVLRIGTIHAQETKHKAIVDAYTVEYSKLNGRFHGTYTSYYSNGQKRAEGQYRYNLRTGKWNLWDSTGALISSRVYNGPLSYERTFPPYPKNDPTIRLVLDDLPEPKRSAEGFYPYHKVEERSVVWSKRVWRELKTDLNESTFRQQQLFDTLIGLYRKDSISLYADKWEKIPFDPNLSTKELVGFRIMEDSFFDAERILMETRILALIPLVIDPVSSDTVELGRFYMPHLRRIINKLPVQGKDHCADVHTLDDLFFFRDFASEVYKVSNVYNFTINEYNDGTDPQKEAERIELLIIETEHDFWKGFSGGNFVYYNTK